MLSAMKRSLIVLVSAAFIAAGIWIADAGIRITGSGISLDGAGGGYAFAAVGSIAEGEDIQYDKTHGLLSSLGFDTSKMPGTYDPDATTNPYGSNVSTMEEVEEMVLLRLMGGQNVSVSGSEEEEDAPALLNHLDEYSEIPKIEGSESSFSGPSSALYGHNKKLDGAYSSFKSSPVENGNLNSYLSSHAFMAAAKVDVNGNGRDSLLAIAYTNYSYLLGSGPENDKKIYLLLYDPRTGAASVPIVIAEFGDNQRRFDFLVQSQIQVTAGDYDKDSIDEIAVYAPASGENDSAKVKIFDLYEGKDCLNPLSSQAWSLAWNYKLPVSDKKVIVTGTSGDKYEYMTNVYNNVDLTSGDADNDGICDLIISYGASDTEYGTKSTPDRGAEQTIQRSIPSRTVLLYGNERGQMLKDAEELSYGDSDLIRVSFAFGDVNGDGNEDMFIAGQLKSEQAENISRVLGKYIYDSDGEEMDLESMENFQIVDGKWSGSRWSSSGKFTSSNGWDGYYNSAPLMNTNLTIGNVLGNQSDTKIYLDSVLYSYTDGKFDIVDELEDDSKKPKYEDDTSSTSQNHYKGSHALADLRGYHATKRSDINYASVYYEYGADSGNFAGGLDDYMLINRVTIPKSFIGDKNYDYPVVNAITILSKRDDDSGFVKRNATYGSPSKKLDGQYMGAPLLLTTADSDEDSLVATYTGVHNISYQNPKVLAVLASAPYFKDVAAYDDNNMLGSCSTSYGKSSGASHGYTSTYSSSLGIFLNVEIGRKSLHGIANVNVGWARSETWGHDDTREFEISYSTGGGEDAVVMYSIPSENYMYRVEGVSVNDDGSYEKCSQLMTVANQHKPVTQTLQLEDYMEIQEHNKDNLPDITKYLTSTPGEPGTYPKSESDISKEAKKNLVDKDTGDKYAGIAYGSGTVSQSITYSHSEQDRYRNHMDGWGGSIEVGFGNTFGDTAGELGYLTLNGGLRYEFQRMGGYTNSTLSGVDCSGTVANMPRAAKGYGYDFSWKLFKYEVNDKSQFPIISYIVDDESSPPQLPDNIAQDFERTTDSQICLTWTYNHGNPSEFDIYRYEDFPQGGGDKLVGTVKGGDYKIKKDENGNTLRDKDGNIIKEYSFIETGLTADTKYQYRMKVKRVKTPNESIFSPVVEARTDVGTKPQISLSADELVIYPDSKYDLSVLLADPENYQSERSYQWQKYNEKARKWEDIEGCTKEKIQFYNCEPADEGEYRCRVNLIRKVEGHPQYISAYTDKCVVTFSLRSVRFGQISVFPGQGDSATNTGLSLSVYNSSDTSLVKPTGRISFTIKGPNGTMKISDDIDEATGVVKIQSIEDMIGTLGQKNFVDGGYLITARYEGSNIFYPADCPDDYHYLRNIDECMFLSTRSSYEFGEDVSPTMELLDFKKDKTGNITREDLTDKIKTIEFYAVGDNDHPTGQPVATYKLSETNGVAEVPLAMTLEKRAYIAAYTSDDTGDVSKAAAGNAINTTKIALDLKVKDKMTGVDELLEFMSYKDIEYPDGIDPEKRNIIQNGQEQSLSDYISFNYYEQNGDFICDSGHAQENKDKFVPASYKVVTAFAGDYIKKFYKPTFGSGAFMVVGNYYLVSAQAKDRNTGSVQMIQPDKLTDFTDVGYAGGTKLTLKALPDKGYEVRSWIINECGVKKYTVKSGEKLDYIVKSSSFTGHGEQKGKIMIKAVMTPKDNKLTYGVMGNGTIGVEPSINSGDTVLADTKLTFTGTPAAGWHFEEWRWNNTGGSNIVADGTTDRSGVNKKTFTMPDNSAELYGVFSKDTIDIAASDDLVVSYINKGGANPDYGEGEEVVTEKGRKVPKGMHVIVKTKQGVELASGSKWVVRVKTPEDPEGSEPGDLKEITAQGRAGCEFTLPEDVTACSVTAETVKGKYTVTAADNDVEFTIKVNGSIKNGTTTTEEGVTAKTVTDIENGSQVDIIGKPKRGIVIDKWIVNGEEKTSDDNSYSTTIKENLNVTLKTKEDERADLTLKTEGGGTAKYVITDKNGDTKDAGGKSHGGTFSGTEVTATAYKGESVHFVIDDSDKNHTMNAIYVDGERQDLDEGEYTIEELAKPTSVVCKFGPNKYHNVKFVKNWKTSEPQILDEDGADVEDGSKLIVADGGDVEFSVIIDRHRKCSVNVNGEDEPLQATGPPEMVSTDKYKYSYKITNVLKDEEITVSDYNVIYIYQEEDFYAYIDDIRDNSGSPANQPDGILMNDIVLSDKYSHDSLDERTPTANYSTFYGNGHRISGDFGSEGKKVIRLGTPDNHINSEFHGLFGDLQEGAVIKDLWIDGLEVYTYAIKPSEYIGMLAGDNYGTISNVTLTDTRFVSTDKSVDESNSQTVSALAAENCGTIKNCMVSGFVLETTSIRANAGSAGAAVNMKKTVDEKTITGLMDGNYFEDFSIKAQGEAAATAATDKIVVFSDQVEDLGAFNNNHYKAIYDIEEDPDHPGKVKWTADKHGISVYSFAEEPKDQAKAEEEAATLGFARKTAYKMNIAAQKDVWGNPVNPETEPEVWGETPRGEKSILQLASGSKEARIQDGSTYEKYYTDPIKTDFVISDEKVYTKYMVPCALRLPKGDKFGIAEIVAWKIEDAAYSPGVTVAIKDNTVISAVSDYKDYVAKVTEYNNNNEVSGVILFEKMDDAAKAVMSRASAETPPYRQELNVIGDCELTINFTVDEKTTITVEKGRTFTISKDSQIDNKGEIDIEIDESADPGTVTPTVVNKYGIITNESLVNIPKSTVSQQDVTKYCKFYNYGTKFTDKGSSASVKDRGNIICKPHIHGEWTYAEKPETEGEHKGQWKKTSTCEVCSKEVVDYEDPDPPASEIESIEILKEPDRTAYEVGEKFSDEGLIVVANMTNGTRAMITDYTLALKLSDEEKDLKNEDELNEKGSAKVIVKYFSFRADFGIGIYNTADLLTITDNSGKDVAWEITGSGIDMLPADKLGLHASLKEKMPYKTKFKWETDNGARADIEAVSGKDNTVTAGKPGDAVITVTVTDEQGNPIESIEPKTVRVSVISHITDLEIIGDDININKGQSHEVEVKVTPADTTDKLEWSIGDEKIATVDDMGFVTGVRGGTTTVTVKSPGGLSDSRKVYVHEKAKSLELDPDSLEVRKEGFAAISARATSETANGEVIWTIEKDPSAGDPSDDPVCGFYVKNEKTGEMEIVDSVTTQLSGDGSAYSDSYVIVTGLKAGSVIVKAKTKADGDADEREVVDGMLEKTCTVTVTDVPTDSYVSLTHNGAAAGGQTMTLDLEGKYIQLGATTYDCTDPDNPQIMDDDTYTWSVLDDVKSPVLRVDSTGKVTLKRKGTAAVRVMSNKTGSLDVLMINVVIRPKGLTLSDSEKTLKKGDKYELTATLHPEDAEGKIEWSSSNTKIATVSDNGRITAVSKGSCTITAKADADGVEPASCKLTVTENEIKVKVELSAKDLKVKVGASKTLKAKVTPANAEGKVLWSSSNPKIAKVSADGKVTGVKPGKANITAAFSKPGSSSAVCKVTVYKENKPGKPAAPLAQLNAKGKNKLVFSWGKVKGAQGYDIFFARCNHNCKIVKMKLIKTVKAGKRKVTLSKLKTKKPYKARIKAWVKKNGKKKYIATSPVVHSYAANKDKKHTNVKAVKVKKKNVTLKKGKTFKIKAKLVKFNKKKKVMSSSHAPKIRYMSTNKKIATVSKSGKIKAKSKGKCKIYVYAVNGKSKTVKVTVK